MIKTIALALTATALMAAPAMAAAACSGSFALDKEYYTEAQINDYNEDLLRSRGVDVVRAEQWGGCIRAFVRTADGREEMQFFEPLNLRRVQ
ncbi:MAG: hypothetical protein P0Y65_13330 [Candidatus Devosia phytovorans]|uniref:PepSY domain-containing protein n=1 Tax=Candidatus Devosia phytovorans TaxID=3121372 RepID=A0AAJ5VS74_9HYPH|nr:hypothetical protein [Devosia sp.]WEK03181.1 MAG: hypothetical protein P0Y65_13330 [Devosia sp.]